MKNKLVIFCVFLCCTIIISSIFLVYSKYRKSTNVNSYTEIAEPIFEVEDSELNTIDFLNNDTYSYEFKIKNFKDDKVSGINFEYNIEFILSQENAPINLKLYRIDNENKVELELIKNKTMYKEQMGIEKEEKNYIVEIMYDKNSTHILENDLQIELNVEAIQREVSE